MTPTDPVKRADIGAMAYSLGYGELGSIFTSFSHLLLRHASDLGSKRLAFISRDGDFLMRCTERLAERTGSAARPVFSYVHISRRTSFLPAFESIDKQMLEAALGLRGKQCTLANALDFLGMPLAPIAPTLSRLAILGELTDVAPETISMLVGDEQFQFAVSRESRRQKALLAAYLEQERIGTGVETLLVDIGWRGSIVSNLNAAFAGAPGFEPPACAFLGLWAEGTTAPRFPMGAVGLIADITRRRNLLEASAWFAAFLLEAICRANEGTTVGYEAHGEKVTPILAGDSESRRAEEQSLPVVAEIRRGVIDFIDEHGSTTAWIDASSDQLRRRAQWSLLRLSCFPQADDIKVGARLVHTEGHTPDWWMPLIDIAGTTSLSHPRHWLAGLASPWRAGYIRHTGGPILAVGFLLLEAALLATSPKVRSRISRIARREAC